MQEKLTIRECLGNWGLDCHEHTWSFVTGPCQFTQFNIDPGDLREWERRNLIEEDMSFSSFSSLSSLSSLSLHSFSWSECTVQFSYPILVEISSSPSLRCFSLIIQTSLILNHLVVTFLWFKEISKYFGHMERKKSIFERWQCCLPLQSQILVVNLLQQEAGKIHCRTSETQSKTSR